MRTLTVWYSGWISGFMVELPAPQSAPIYAWFDRKLRVYTTPEYLRQGAPGRRSRQAPPTGTPGAIASCRSPGHCLRRGSSERHVGGTRPPDLAGIAGAFEVEGTPLGRSRAVVGI